MAIQMVVLKRNQVMMILFIQVNHYIKYIISYLFIYIFEFFLISSSLVQAIKGFFDVGKLAQVFTGSAPSVEEDEADKEAIRKSYLELKAKKRLEEQLKKTEKDLKDNNTVLSPYDPSKPANTGWSSFLQGPAEEKPMRPTEIKKKRLEDEFEAWRKSKEAIVGKYESPAIGSKFEPKPEYHMKPIILPEAPTLHKKHIVVDAAGDLDDGIPEEWEPEDDEQPDPEPSGPSFEELASSFFDKTVKTLLTPLEYIDFKMETAPTDESIYHKNKEYPDEWILYRHENYVPIYDEFDKAKEKLAADQLAWKKYNEEMYDELNQEQEELNEIQEKPPAPVEDEIQQPPPPFIIPPAPTLVPPAPFNITPPAPVIVPKVDPQEKEQEQEQAERLRLQEIILRENEENEKKKIEAAQKKADPIVPAPIVPSSFPPSKFIISPSSPSASPETTVVEETPTEFEEMLASTGAKTVVYLPTKDGSAKSKRARILSDIGSPSIEIEIKSSGEKKKLKFDVNDIVSIKGGNGPNLTLPDDVDSSRVIHFNIRGKPELNIEFESDEVAKTSLIGFLDILRKRTTPVAPPKRVTLKWVCFAELEEKKMLSSTYVPQLLIYSSNSNSTISQYVKGKGNATSEIDIIPKLRPFKEGGWEDDFLIKEGWILKGTFSLTTIDSVTSKAVKGVDCFAEILTPTGVIVYRLPDTNMRNMFVKFLSSQNSKP